MNIAVTLLYFGKPKNNYVLDDFSDNRFHLLRCALYHYLSQVRNAQAKTNVYVYATNDITSLQTSIVPKTT